MVDQQRWPIEDRLVIRLALPADAARISEITGEEEVRENDDNVLVAECDGVVVGVAEWRSGEGELGVGHLDDYSLGQVARRGGAVPVVLAFVKLPFWLAGSLFRSLLGRDRPQRGVYVYVQKNARGQGIGHVLLREVQTYDRR